MPGGLLSDVPGAGITHPREAVAHLISPRLAGTIAVNKADDQVAVTCLASEGVILTYPVHPNSSSGPSWAVPSDPQMQAADPTPHTWPQNSPPPMFIHLHVYEARGMHPVCP